MYLSFVERERERVKLIHLVYTYKSKFYVSNKYIESLIYTCKKL